MSSRNPRKRPLEDPGPSPSPPSSPDRLASPSPHSRPGSRQQSSISISCPESESQSDRSEPPRKKQKPHSGSAPIALRSYRQGSEVKRDLGHSRQGSSVSSTDNSGESGSQAGVGGGELPLGDQLASVGRSILGVGLYFAGTLFSYAKGVTEEVFELAARTSAEPGRERPRESNTRDSRASHQDEESSGAEDRNQQGQEGEPEQGAEEEEEIIDLTRSSASCTSSGGSRPFPGPDSVSSDDPFSTLPPTSRREPLNGHSRHHPYHSTSPSASSPTHRGFNNGRTPNKGSLRETLARRSFTSSPSHLRTSRSDLSLHSQPNGHPSASSSVLRSPDMASDLAKRLRTKFEIKQEQARKDKKDYHADGIRHAEAWRSMGAPGPSVGRSSSPASGSAPDREIDGNQHASQEGGGQRVDKGKGKARETEEKPLPPLPGFGTESASRRKAKKVSTRDVDGSGLSVGARAELKSRNVSTGPSNQRRIDLGGTDTRAMELQAAAQARGDRDLNGKDASQLRKTHEQLWQYIGGESNPPDANGARSSGIKTAVSAGLGMRLINARWERDIKATLKAREPREQEVIELPLLSDLRIKDSETDAEIRAKFKSAEPRLPALTKDEIKAAEAARRNKRFIAKCAREQVEYGDIQRLEPGQWLNDEIINFYGAMIQKRADEDMVLVGGVKKKRRDIHYFNSFFFSKMASQGYAKSNLGRWTKTFDIFKKDIVIFPINLGNAHWVCAAINFVDKRIEFYDSYSDSPREQVYEVLRQYLQDESKAKKQRDFDFSGWEDYWDSTAPQQTNGVDCGVFACQTLEHRGRGLGDVGHGDAVVPWEFDQKHIRYIRLLMVHEIQQGALEERSQLAGRALE